MDDVRTLILVAEDCPVQTGIAPSIGRAGPTVAGIQHAMLAEAPFTWTEDDVLFESWWRRQDGDAVPAAERAAIRAAFLAKSRPCLRASPLPMRYGWGLAFDRQGRIALCPMESPEYARLASGADGVEVLKSFRSSRRSRPA